MSMIISDIVYLRGMGVRPQCIPFYNVGNNEKQGIRKK